MIRTWTEEQKAFLRENYGTLSYPEIAAALGKPVGHVKSKASAMKITKSRAWPEEKIEELRRRYPNEITQRIADDLGKPISTVYSMAKKLGLAKTEEFQNSELSGRLTKFNAEERGGHSRFQKGQTSWNKGTKGICGTHPNSRRTQFRKGQKPHNTLPVGAEVVSTDGYRKIKIAEPNTWEFVHRRTWEAAHGPIPPGEMIRFKDGDQMNCDLDNLMLITRTEHALYNSKWNIPAEIVPAMAALSTLKKELNNYAQEQTD